MSKNNSWNWQNGARVSRGPARTSPRRTADKLMPDSCLQPADLADKDPRGRVRLLVGAGATAVRGARHHEEGRPPEVQLLHVRVRPGTGAPGDAAELRAPHIADLPPGERRTPHRRERHRHRLGQTQRGRHLTLGSAGGKTSSPFPSPAQQPPTLTPITFSSSLLTSHLHVRSLILLQSHLTTLYKQNYASLA
jgi:hypothetical protein